jgi:hypothetical protein
MADVTLGKVHLKPINRGPGGAKSKSEDSGAVKTFCPCQESNDKPTRYTDYATSIFSDAVSRPVYTVDDMGQLS